MFVVAPEDYYGNVGPWSKPVSFQNFKPGEEYNNWSGSPGSESAGHRSGSSEDGEPVSSLHLVPFSFFPNRYLMSHVRYVP